MRIMSARRTGYALAMAALLAAGLSTGTRLYYLIFLVLALMLALSLVSVAWTLLSLRCALTGVRARVTRGDSLTTTLTVRHTCLLPVSVIRVGLSVPSAVASQQEVHVSTPPFTKRAYRQKLLCPHRGVYETGVVRVTVEDVFGLVRLSRRMHTPPVRMQVLPRVSKIRPMRLQNTDTGPEMHLTSTEDTASPADVRAWQEGDELKRVHWKLSLRKRELLVRTYEDSTRPDTLVIPDLQKVAALKDQQLMLEDCVCEAALNAAKAQLEAGYPVRMPLTNAHPIELAAAQSANFTAMLEAMAVVPFDCPCDYERVLTLMQARMQRTGGAVLVTARLTSGIADIVLRMQRVGIATRLIWVTDDARDDALTMLERLRMAGVQAEHVDPWSANAGAAAVSADYMGDNPAPA